MIYEYAAVWVPTDKQREDDGSIERIVVPITSCLAPNPQVALSLAARAIPEAEVDNIAQIKVMVRPFANL